MCCRYMFAHFSEIYGFYLNCAYQLHAVYCTVDLLWSHQSRFAVQQWHSQTNKWLSFEYGPGECICSTADRTNNQCCFSFDIIHQWCIMLVIWPFSVCSTFKIASVLSCVLSWLSCFCWVASSVLEVTFDHIWAMVWSGARGNITITAL